MLKISDELWDEIRKILPKEKLLLDKRLISCFSYLFVIAIVNVIKFLYCKAGKRSEK